MKTKYGTDKNKNHRCFFLQFTPDWKQDQQETC